MRKVVVVPYDQIWPEKFRTESLLIQSLAGEVIRSVHHIGSTSVPGLSAKPVIDILLEVSDINELDKYNAVMTLAGYSVRGENGIPGRRYITRGGEQRTHQIHAFSAGDWQVLRHLVFRDYLIENSKIADEYAAVKYTAALLSKNDVQRYSTLKAAFIERHLKQALINLVR